jgi:hypothetical protein
MKPAPLFFKQLIYFFLAGALTASCSFFAGKENQNPFYELTQDELELLQPGDIILRQGFGAVSHAIGQYLNEPIRLSHVALLSRGNNGEWQVIQSISQRVSKVDGVQQQDLTSFVSESETSSIVVVRFRGYETDQGLHQRIEQAALNYLEQQVPFDHSFSLEDSARFFCSELIWRLFLIEAKVDIFEKMNKDVRRERLRFASFFNPDHFEVIINHHSNKD